MTLTPQCGANAPAVMNVNFDGRTYSFEVKPGPEGYRQFTEAIRCVARGRGRQEHARRAVFGAAGRRGERWSGVC